MATKTTAEDKTNFRTRSQISKKETKKETETETKTAPTSARYLEQIGRRKEAVARVRFIKGKPGIVINGKPLGEYFKLPTAQHKVLSPFRLNQEIAKAQEQFYISIKVRGGGITGQAEAIRLGISRCLAKINEAWKPVLRKAGYLTRDARIVERKKYGRRKARKRAQWSKR